jgi:N-acetylmuramoyl-L-alanine amidase
MAKKIYISPSSQTTNKYAKGNTTEAIQCRKIAVALVPALERCGFDAMTNLTGDMYARTSESNKWGADLHVPIHTNAHNKKVMGTRLFSYDLKGEGYKACKAIMATLAPITPGTSDSITANKSLYEVKKANAPTAYIEVGFHDNVTEALWIIDNTEAIAETICKGICKYFSVPYVDPVVTVEPEPPAKEETAGFLYRVFNGEGKQLGAYSLESGAFTTAKKELRKSGAVKITYGAK